MRVLFSTKEGRVSFEDDTLRQGIFTYFLAKGLGGDAAEADGLVTFRDLADYVTDRMRAYTVERGQVQIPFEAAGEESSGDFLLSAKPVLQAGATNVNEKDGLTYVWIPPGTFQMGCSPGDTECVAAEKPAHEVTLTTGFWMGQTPVTQEAYQRVIGNNPSHFKGDQLPVEQVNWNEAQGYCQAAGMRLPTEAEWEYAARGGSTASRYGDPDRIAWYSANSGNTTHAVGQKEANAFGLHDMLGNVWQWVADWYAEYPAGPQRDPAGPGSGQYRALRGGSGYNVPRGARASSRFRGGPVSRGYGIGLRCAGN
jgi:formylglycine-generating enzyme required for sulfatase activity